MSRVPVVLATIAVTAALFAIAMHRREAPASLPGPLRADGREAIAPGLQGADPQAPQPGAVTPPLRSATAGGAVEGIVLVPMGSLSVTVPAPYGPGAVLAEIFPAPEDAEGRSESEGRVEDFAPMWGFRLDAVPASVTAHFGGLRPGRWGVRATVRGWLGTRPLFVDLGPGEERDEILIPPPGRFHGLVINDAGEPVSEAKVTAELGATGTGTWSDAKGRFEFRADGTAIDLRVEHRYYRSLVRRSVPSGDVTLLLEPRPRLVGRLVSQHPLPSKIGIDEESDGKSAGGGFAPLAPDGSFSHVLSGTPDPTLVVMTVEGHRILAIAPRVYDRDVDVGSIALDRDEIEGTVVAPDGTPVKEAWVSMPPTAQTRVSLCARTNADGGFSLPGVPSGDVTLVARSWRYATTPHATGGLRSVRIQMRAGVRVRGTLRRDGAPLADADLRWTPEDDVPVATSTSASGAFVSRPFLPGRVRVEHVRDDGTRTPLADLVLHEGEPPPVEWTVR